MKHLETVAVTAQATFGRDGAMFEGLLGFVAQLSLVLWGLVTFTAVIRFVGIRIYRRGAARAARTAAVVPSAVGPATAAVVPSAVLPAAVVPAATLPAAAAEIDLVRVAAGQLTDGGLVRLGLFGSAASVKGPRHAPRHRLAESRSSGSRASAHVPVLAANSRES